MRRVLVSLLLVSSAQAQTPYPSMDLPKTVKCMPTRVAFETLRNQFKEIPVILSINTITDKRIAITQADDGSWTIIEFDERTACLLAIGDKMDLTPLAPKPDM